MADIIYINSLKGTYSESCTPKDETKNDLATGGQSNKTLSKWIARLAAIIPISFSLWVVLTQIALDIWIFDREHYFIYNAVFLALSVLWSIAAPWRKHFSGPIMSVIYNLIPVMLYLSLYYSQWHFGIVYILSCVWACVTYFSWIKLDRADTNDPNYEKKHNRSTTFVWRRAIASLLVLLLVPAIFGAVHMARQSEMELLRQEHIYPYMVDTISNCNSKKELYEQAQDTLFGSFSEEKWRMTPPEEKADYLLKLAQFDCGTLGVSMDNLIGLRLETVTPEGLNGYYDRHQKVICLSAAVVNGSNRDKAVQALLAATFNYYQYQLVTGLDWDSDFAQSSYLDQARTWKENMFNHYYSQEELDEASFLSQPIFKDAIAYADEELQTLRQYFDG